jgi:hypothetical protein
MQVRVTIHRPTSGIKKMALPKEFNLGRLHIYRFESYLLPEAFKLHLIHGQLLDRL